MADVAIPRRDVFETLSSEDLETASIRSAAPSYRSTAPTLHYTVPYTNGDHLPPYTAPPAGSPDRVTGTTARRRRPNGTPASRSTGSLPSSAVGPFGAAPAPGTVRGHEPTLTQFRIPSWSTISQSPNAHLYHSVAVRRAAAAENASAAAEFDVIMRRRMAVQSQMQEEEAAASRRMAAASARRAAQGGSSSASSASSRPATRPATAHPTFVGSRSSTGPSARSNARPQEDPLLVGEAAARRARAERHARENQDRINEALAHEDRRWDWFLGQVRNRQSSGSDVLSPSSRLRRHLDPVMLRHSRGRQFLRG